ncbi:MAG TPA: T9SS type A sorting domain-containing protein [Bacteroidia bacterium]|jgi:hypothetical protein|nr:T9SS type A sorting domain-containing protein [Bacteroidia bacterium]
MKKNYNYNELVRFYNRSCKKLSNLLTLGKNEYKQDILKRRIARLFQLLTGMQTQLKLSTATCALTIGFVLFQPNAASAQSFPTHTVNPFGLVAIPTPTAWSSPTFVDLDNDGDEDIMAGNNAGNFYYYQNTGTASAPTFSAPVMNPFGLANTGSGYASPTFVDLDNDGDMDMVSGAGSGAIYYYQNTGTASAPAFAAGFAGPYGITSVSAYSSGSFIDLDNDGDQDFMSGDKVGTFTYFQNTGTVSAPAFAPGVLNAFGLSVNATAAYSTVAFTDFDADGDKDMWSSDGGSAFNYYLNTGTASAPAFAAPTLNPFSLTALTNNGTCPTFTDLDSDGDQDLLSGLANGNLVYFENSAPLGIKTINLANGVSVYPNPTTSNINLNIKNTSEVLSIEVSNVLGQVISAATTINENNSIALPEAKGVYFVKVTDKANKNNIFKVVKN